MIDLAQWRSASTVFVCAVEAFITISGMNVACTDFVFLCDPFKSHCSLPFISTSSYNKRHLIIRNQAELITAAKLYRLHTQLFHMSDKTKPPPEPAPDIYTRSLIRAPGPGKYWEKELPSEFSKTSKGAFRWSMAGKPRGKLEPKDITPGPGQE
jgi:hypothetical protein